jgi:hypothetical protein
MDIPDVTDITRPKYPEGTPEYEAYREQLAVELARFAAGEPPYQVARPIPPAPLIEGNTYQVTTADGRRIVAFYKPIDGIKANHPWVGEDEARHRSDAVTDIRPAIVVDPQVALHQVAAMLAMGNPTAQEILTALTMGARS